MKPVLIIAAAVAVLAASPAFAQYVPPQIFDAGAQDRAYPSGEERRLRPCFNGSKISAVSRTGQHKLLVQTGNGAVYELRTSKTCTAVDQAQQVTARSGRDPAVCVADTAVLFLRTPDGPKRCHVADVRRLASGEMARR